MKTNRRTLHTLLYLALFAVGFAFVESTVVVYLRSLYYPEGFRFPLALMGKHHILSEVAREVATIVMLVSVALLAGTRAWERFGYFLVAFGVWDIFYYVWLKVLLDWPAKLADWDVLFLIPLPWIGPVIAPVLISVVMIWGGVMLVRRSSSDGSFHFGRAAWVLSVTATIIAFYSFISDSRSVTDGAIPSGYRYELLAASIVLYVAAFVLAGRPSSSHDRPH